MWLMPHSNESAGDWCGSSAYIHCLVGCVENLGDTGVWGRGEAGMC